MLGEYFTPNRFARRIEVCTRYRVRQPVRPRHLGSAAVPSGEAGRHPKSRAVKESRLFTRVADLLSADVKAGEDECQRGEDEQAGDGNPSGRRLGEHVFLEVNPCGEWGMLERTPGLPIPEAIADLLLGHAPRRTPAFQNRVL